MSHQHTNAIMKLSYNKNQLNALHHNNQFNTFDSNMHNAKTILITGSVLNAIGLLLFVYSVSEYFSPIGGCPRSSSTTLLPCDEHTFLTLVILSGLFVTVGVALTIRGIILTKHS